MAGRLLAAGCAEATEPRDRRPHRDQHVRDPRGRRAEGHRPAGPPDRLKSREPGPARRPDRLLGPRARPRRPAPPLPGGRPVPPPRRGARAGRSARAGLGPGARSDDPRPAGATTIVGRTVVGAADHLPGLAGGRGDRRHGRPRVRRSAPGCRSSTAATRRAPTASSRSAAGPERSRPFDDDRRRGARARRGRLPGGHAARPERQLVRPRPAGGAALRAHRHRALGRPPPRSGRPARPGRAHPGDRRHPDRRRRPGDPAAPVRDVAPVGPVGPADRGDGRLPVGLRAPPPAGPVGRRCGPAPDGPPVHGRALPRAPGGDPGGRPGDRHLDRRDRRVLRRDRGPVRGDARRSSRPSATTRCSRRPTRSDPGRRRRGSPTTWLRERQTAAPERAARGPGGDRPRAQPGLGRPDGRGPRRGRDAGPVARPRRRESGRRGGRGMAAGATVTRPDARAQARPPGRRRPTSSGRLVEAPIDHAGPYALRGTIADRGRPGPRGSTPRLGELRLDRSSAAARRHRRGDRDRQDRACRSGSRPGSGSGAAGRDRVGRLAPGLPRSRHRDGQGERGRPSPGSASRPRPRRPGRAVQRRRLRASTPGGRSPGSPDAAGSRSSSGAPGCTCAPSVAGFATEALPSDADLRARLEARARRRRARRARRSACARSRRERRPAVDLRNPRRVVRALEIAELPGRRVRSRRRVGYPGARAWLGLAAPDPWSIGRWIGAGRAGPVRGAACSTRPRPCASATTRTLPAFSAIGYREAWDVLDGQATLDAAIATRRRAQRRVREAPADLVPRRARDRLARCRPTGPTAGRDIEAVPPVHGRCAGREAILRRMPRTMIDLSVPVEKAFLVGVDTGDDAGWPVEDSLAELASLATTAGRRRRRGGVAEPPPRRPELVPRQGQGRGARGGQGRDRLRRAHRRRRAVARPAARARGAAQRQGHRPQRG